MHLTRPQLALAASVAALAVAAPLAFQLTKSGLPNSGSLAGYDRGYSEPAGKPTEIARLDDKTAPDISLRKSEEKRTEQAAPEPVAALEHDAKKDKAAQVAAQPQTLPSDPATLAPPSPPLGPTQSEAWDHIGRSQIGLAEPNPNPATDGLGAVGTYKPAMPYEGENQRLANQSKTMDAAPPAGAAGLSGSGLVAVAPPAPSEQAKWDTAPAPMLGADINTEAGRRMLRERPVQGSAVDGRLEAAKPATAYDPYAHMDEVDRQKVIAEQEYRDKFEAAKQNPVRQVSAEPVSTFSIDVDTASYSFVRRALTQGQLPPKDAVRVEEMINYFPYAYPKPATAEVPFQPTITVVPSPWSTSNQLVHVAIKGYDLSSAERPRANLVFLIDVSGSMSSNDKLPLVKNAFRMLVDEMRPDDTIGIVTYASGSGVLLEPTKVADKSKIHAAIEKLGAGGSTAGAEGIQDAYRLAEGNYDQAAVNRVILATDGDFNVGVTSQDDLKGLIERKREKGIFLSILGVGQGNYNDSLMQTLAQNGNGTAAYVDTLYEARKVLVDEASSTLFTIAKDVKIQIEWNPARVSEYRLIGYETRALAREDFNNDKIDAGDIGSGHTVTAIYEVTPAGAPPMADDLRYGKAQKTASAERAQPATIADDKSSEIGFLKLRYKLPKEDASKLVTLTITQSPGGSLSQPAYEEARFSIAVAAFGQLLKGSPHMRGFTYDDVLALAQSARGDDRFGYRSEFLNLVRLAKSARP